MIMSQRLVTVSLFAVLLASCGGGSSSPATNVPGDTTGDENSSGGTPSGGGTIANGETVSPIRCVEESLSLTDSEYDVFLDAPNFANFQAISESLTATEQFTVDDLTVSVVMSSLGLAMLSVGTPATYTSAACNHSLYLDGQCAVPGAEVDASLASGVLTGTILFPDTTVIDFTIDSADNSSGSMMYTEAGTANVQSFQWNRSQNGTETFSNTTPEAIITFEEQADCSGSAVVTLKDGDIIESVQSASWTSPRNSDFVATMESCRYDDSLVTCNTVIRP